MLAICAILAITLTKRIAPDHTRLDHQHDLQKQPKPSLKVMTRQRQHQDLDHQNLNASPHVTAQMQRMEKDKFLMRIKKDALCLINATLKTNLKNLEANRSNAPKD